MKKILASILVLTCLFALGGCAANTAKDIEELKDYLAKELEFERSEIQYAGEYVDDEDALVWFIVEREPQNQYISISCKLKGEKSYHINEIMKPSVYAMDIVHSVWEKDIFLINNQSCTQIVMINDASEIVSQIDITEEQYPFIFDIDSFSDPFGGGRIMFMDSNGEEIR